MPQQKPKFSFLIIILSDDKHILENLETLPPQKKLTSEFFISGYIQAGEIVPPPADHVVCQNDPR